MAVAPPKPRVSVGPVPYYWAREDILSFYEQIAAGPADIVYLGETVCPKRNQLRTADWFALGRELRSAGAGGGRVGPGPVAPAVPR